VRHYHARARQLFFVLEGELAIDVRNEQFQLRPQDSLEVVPGDPHGVRNAGTRDAIFLVISAPTTRGDRTNLP
jgi:mannose-6-phosphate isomerase-like protein (cupin superfamily)